MLRAEAYLPHLNQEYYSDFDKIYPWSEIGRYLVNKDTKAIKCKLDFNNSNREAITMRAIDWAAEEATSDVDVIIPIFAIKIWFDDTNRKHIQVQRSNPILSGLNDGFEIHPAFVRADGSLRDRIHIAAFEGCLINEQVRSLPNKAILKGINLDYARTKSRVGRDTCSNALTIDIISACQCLYLVEFANLNSQRMLGDGVCRDVQGYTNPQNTGRTLDIGDKSGYFGTNGTNMSYRGIENLYGNKWKIVDGIRHAPDGYAFCKEPLYYDNIGKYEIRAASIETVDTTPSKRGTIQTVHTEQGYKNYFIASSVLVGGNYDNKYGDIYHIRTNTTTHSTCLYGGSHYDVQGVGIFAWANYNNSNSDNSTTRLTYLP